MGFWQLLKLSTYRVLYGKLMSFHNHPLIESEEMPLHTRCFVCEKLDGEGGIAYWCRTCLVSVHKECIETFINHPIQCNHFFKLFWDKPQITNRFNCHFCRGTLTSIFAWWKSGNIHMCKKCVKSPPRCTISQPKHHKHSLTLLMRLNSFTCNACGVEEDRNPYVCLDCELTVHGDCLDLPRVIMINRHDHRISHTFHLGETEKGDHCWKCGVCRKTIDWVYGAFKCPRCPRYAVHSRCATREEVWDGRELEDVPEEREIIKASCEVVNENGDIIHFSHENHILQKLDENFVMDIRCECCVLPINGDPCYKCVECEFVLHSACANLPRQKRHLLHNHKLILQVDNKDVFMCKACETFSNGFRYVCYEGYPKDEFSEGKCLEDVYDVRCSSASEPFYYDLHPQHPLFWTLEGSKQCNACLREIQNPLRCAVSNCDYALCMACATLPRKVKSRYNDYFLILSQDAKTSNGDLWCDICETKTDPRICYYTCHESGVTLHIDCVLGGFYYMKEGLVDIPEKYTDEDVRGSPHEVLSNNNATRPVCSDCGYHCKLPFLLRADNNYVKCDRFC